MGIHDDLLDLGGDSLQAVELVTKVREHFHVDVPLQILLEEPTVARLAEWIARAGSENGWEAC